MQRQPPLAVRLETSAVRQQLRYDVGVPARCCKVQSAPACFGQTQLQGLDLISMQWFKCLYCGSSCISHRLELAQQKARVFPDTYQSE